MTSKIRIGLIGLGYWGPNLLRNMAKVPDAEITAVADKDPKRLNQISERQAARQIQDYREILKDTQIDAVMIATPASTHASLVREVLQAGKHVLVEKPLAMSSREGEELAELAGKKKKILMVGHTFLYHEAVLRLKQYMDSGELGKIYYLHSERLNFGRIRRDVNALWNFGPHDVSILLYLLGRMPEEVSANGFVCVEPPVEDVAFATLAFSGGVSANLHVSWLDPQKVRRLTVVGSEKMAVYDDISVDAKITLSERTVEKIPTSASPKDFRTFAEFQMLTHHGDVVVPHFSFREPLWVECEHFADCIKNNKTPRTDGRHGVEVVRVLEACERSMKKRGAPEKV